MNTWFRKVGMGAVALTLAGVLGGCNNGGGGSILLYFGINGSGSCTNVVVDVNLSEANAVLAHDEVGNPSCQLNGSLDNAGCDVSFQEFENGDLRATISGCTIPAVTNLFSCVFDDVDISALQETAAAQCSCKTAGCDTTPPVCISEDPSPTSCEDCSNGQDDDHNGLTDCDDPNCQNSPACEPTTTTTSTSTSITLGSTTTTNSTTTTESTTTSTTLVPKLTCTLIFRMPDDVTLGSLQWDTDYSNAPGELLGQGGNVECASLVEGALAAFNDTDAEQTLDSGLIHLEGFTGPLNVAECTMKAFVQPKAEDFLINVTEASHPDLTPVVPTPDVVITSINCEGVVTTTTTTTTMPGNETTTTTVGGDVPKDFIVTFHLTSASAGVGALQWTADYSAANGEMQGSGSTVSCTNKVAGALFAPNDVDATKKLTLGLIALTPFSAGIDLVTCTFNGFANDAPTPADIGVTIDDATDSDGNTIDAAIGVTVIPAP